MTEAINVEGVDNLIRSVRQIHDRVVNGEFKARHGVIPKDQSYYLCSPYTAYLSTHPTSSAKALDEAWKWSCEIASELTAGRYDVFCPIAHGHALHTASSLPETHAFWMDVDLRHLDRMDAVIVACMPGWDVSTGIKAELDHALRKGKNVYFIMAPESDEIETLSPWGYDPDVKDMTGYRCWSFATAEGEKEMINTEVGCFPNPDAKPKPKLLGKEAILTEALEAVKARGNAYGPVVDNFNRIADRWNVHLNHKYAFYEGLDADDVAIMMMDVKVARLEETPDHWDSIVDIAGYASCLGAIKRGE